MTGRLAIPTPKRLQLLKKAMPKLSRMLVLWNGYDLGKTSEANATRRAAEQLGLAFEYLEVWWLERALHRAFSSRSTWSLTCGPQRRRVS
jgi:hypothetical protein